MSWTDDRVERLKELWFGGKSARQIADLFGDTTRNAVIAKIHRLKLPPRECAGLTRHQMLGSSRKRLARRKKPRTQKQRSEFAGGDSSRQPKPPTIPLPVNDDELVIPLAERKTILTLGPHDCKWPIGDTQDASFHFCGKPQVPTLPYCEHHARRAFQTPNTKTRFRGPVESGRETVTEEEKSKTPEPEVVSG
jgi:GcrA cell cycle regulator